MEFLPALAVAFAGGILPAFIWLFFWLKEDEAHPEPNSLIILTFFLGMLAVPFAFVIQIFTEAVLIGNYTIQEVFVSNYILAIVTIVIWAAAEEIVKYWAAHIGGLSRKANDEPIDPIIYLITAALGFAALENTLFLLNPLFSGESTVAFITGNMRFIGATLVHVGSSAIIGIFISLSYYKNSFFKKRYLLSGFILSIALHSVFNSFIIKGGMKGAEGFTMLGFFLVWFSIIVVILAFEYVKHKVVKKN